MTIFNFISLFGGLALFLYGIQLMGDGLKRGASGAMKKAMEKVTNNSFVGFLFGMLITAVIQSSNATIVLTSGLISAGILTLHQSIGIILGANVGTTITGQMIRLLDVDASGTSWLNFFKPNTLAPLAALIGILFIMGIKTRNSKNTGSIAMGFGILFTGLINMTAAVAPLAESEAFTHMFAELAHQPILGFLVGAGVAFLIQSASAAVGILQALSMTGALTFGSVYSIILGINIGVCITTAIICSIGAKADAKRAGMIHIIYNIFAALLIIVVLMVGKGAGLFDGLWEQTMHSGSIANVNTIFRLATAIALLPACGWFEKLTHVFVKDDKVLGENVDRELAGLDDRLFTAPSLALNSASNAITAMARLARGGVLRAMKVFAAYDTEEIQAINENEEHIDALADRVDNYLIKLSPHIPNGHGNDMLNYYIQCFGEFERIGDYAVNLTENATELREKDVQFSEQAQQELVLLSDALDEILGYAYQSFSETDPQAARHIEPVEEVIDDLVATLRNHHIRRLREGQCTVYAGLIFLDILVNIERIADQCSNLGLYTLGQTDEEVMRSHHDYIQYLHQGKDELFNREFAQRRAYYFDRLEAITK